MDILDGASMFESKIDIVDDPIEPMDPLHPPPSDASANKRPLWLSDTLHDDNRQVLVRR